MTDLFPRTERTHGSHPASPLDSPIDAQPGGRRGPGRAARVWAMAIGLGIGLVLVPLGVFGLAIQSGAADGVLDELDGASPGQAAAPTAAERRMHRLMDRHGCSFTGLPNGVIPASALVEDAGSTGPGALRVTSFDEGWAMQNGDKPGRLVAVCRS